VAAPSENPTVTLTRAVAGDAVAADRLEELVYDELRALASTYLRGPRDPILQTTALVHEAYARLLGRPDIDWESRAHFFAVAAKAMRQTLASHARSVRADKRGGGWRRVTLSEAVASEGGSKLELIVLDDVLERLAGLDPRQARIVELRVLGGMTVKEMGHVLGVSESTVEREWRAARAWLAAELRKQGIG